MFLEPLAALELLALAEQQGTLALLAMQEQRGTPVQMEMSEKMALLAAVCPLATTPHIIIMGETVLVT